jgi:hypothetical protein
MGVTQATIDTGIRGWTSRPMQPVFTEHGRLNAIPEGAA